MLGQHFRPHVWRSHTTRWWVPRDPSSAILRATAWRVARVDAGQTHERQLLIDANEIGGGQQVGLNGEIVGEEVDGKIVVGLDAADAGRRYDDDIWTKPIEQALGFLLSPQVRSFARRGENLATPRAPVAARSPRPPSPCGRPRTLSAPREKTAPGRHSQGPQFPRIAPSRLALEALEV